MSFVSFIKTTEEVMKKAWFLILTAVFSMLAGLSMAATPTPIPTPYVDVQISFSDGSAAVTCATPQVTAVPLPSSVGSFTAPVWNYTLNSTGPVYGRADYGQVLISSDPSGSVVNVTWVKKPQIRSGVYKMRCYSEYPTLTPTDTPEDTPTATPTATKTPTPVPTLVIAVGTPDVIPPCIGAEYLDIATGKWYKAKSPTGYLTSTPTPAASDYAALN